MFCPDGYFLFSEVINAASDAASICVPDAFSSDIPSLPNGMIDWANYKSFYLMLTRTWFELELLSSDDFSWHICSPSGQLLRIGHEFFTETNVSYQFRELLEFQIPKDQDIEPLQEAFLLSSKPMFKFIDTFTGVITYNKESDDENLLADESEYLKDTLYGNPEKIPFMMEPFLGWSLCCSSETSLPTGMDLVKRIGKDPVGSQSASSRGRPSLQQNALFQYRLHFPTGHNGRTWAEVEAKLGVSARTIQRALASDQDRKRSKTGQ